MGSTFTRWLDRAAREWKNHSLVDSSEASQLSEEVPELFDFAKLPYQGTKDIGGGIIHRMYMYHGRFTRPPCTPVLQWFLASEPLIAYSANLAQLVNGTWSPAAATGIAPPASCSEGP